MNRIITRGGIRWLAAALAAVCVAVAAQGGDELDRFALRYPAGSIKSVEQADQALAEAEKARAAIKARFVQQESACTPKFLVSPCVETAKEVQRNALASLRPVEVEAARFKRQAKAQEHDEALIERARQEKLSMPHHQQQQEDFEKNQARREADRLKAEQAAAASEAENEAKIAANAKRQAEREARLARLRAKQAAEAPGRAAKVEAYHQKQEAIKVRQAEREKELAEREKKAAEKALKAAEKNQGATAKGSAGGNASGAASASSAASASK